MYIQTGKSKENKSQSVANDIFQKKSGTKPALQFADNRPEAIIQRKFQEMANNRQVQPLQLAAYGKNCCCPSCTGKSGETTTSSIVQTKASTAASGIIQMARCPIHGNDPDYDDHSDRTCPDMQSEEESKEEKKEKADEAPVKKKGWQKQSGVKPGRSPRDKRKRTGHGMMTKEQLARYGPGH